MARSTQDLRICFTCEQWDEFASLKRSYHLFFYPKDGSIEMMATKERKLVLKRTSYPGVRRDQLFPGAELSIMGKMTTILAYGDEVTRQLCEGDGESAIVLLSDEGFSSLGMTLSMLTVECGLTVNQMAMAFLTRASIEDMLLAREARLEENAVGKELQPSHVTPRTSSTSQAGQTAAPKEKMASATLCDQSTAEMAATLRHFADRRCVVVKVVGAAAIEKAVRGARRINSSATVTATAATSSALVATAETAEDAALWGRFFLAPALQTPFFIRDQRSSSVVVIKPHVLQHRKCCGGEIIQQVLDAGFEPTGLMQLSLSSRRASMVLEAYKSVVPDFNAMVDSMTGLVWVLQVVSLNDDDGSPNSVDTVQSIRNLCGPFDVAIAKRIRPQTIRARFGVNRDLNAVHCCDLPEDGELYSNYFFGNA